MYYVMDRSTTTLEHNCFCSFSRVIRCRPCVFSCIMRRNQLFVDIIFPSYFYGKILLNVRQGELFTEHDIHGAKKIHHYLTKRI